MKIDASRKLICAGTGLVALDIVVNGTGKERYIHTGGSCANVMSFLGFLGWSPYLVARLGKDPAGLTIRKELRQLGVTLKSPVGSAAPTPIIVQRNSSKHGIITHSFSRRCPSCGTWFPSFSPLPRVDAHHLIRKFPENLAVFYFDRVSAGILELTKAAKDANALIVFEPSSKVDDHHFLPALEMSNIVKYSHDRFPSIPKSNNPILEIKTFGSDGLAYRTDAKWRKLPAYRVPSVVDQAGAGDWCTAGIIHALLTEGKRAIRSNSWPQDFVVSALQFGQSLGALSCLHEGARGLMYDCDLKTILADVRSLQKSYEVNPTRARQNGKPDVTLRDLCSGCTE